MRTSRYLTDKGFNLQMVDNKLRVTPRSRITPEIRRYIQSNKSMILDEVRGNNLAIVAHEQGGCITDPLNVCPPDIENMDSDECAAALIHFPGVGDLWVIFDERVRAELEADGVPILTEDDFAYIKAGPSRQDRFTRLRKRSAARHPIVTKVLAEFPGSKITNVELKEDNRCTTTRRLIC